MKDFLLFLHIGVGVASLVVCAGAGYAIVTGKKEKYLVLLKSIAIAAGASILSGIGLAVFQATQEAVYGLCVRIFLYLLVVGSVEGMLWFKMNVVRRNLDTTDIF